MFPTREPPKDSVIRRELDDMGVILRNFKISTVFDYTEDYYEIGTTRHFSMVSAWLAATSALEKVGIRR
jgi:hypothetical protein